MSNFLSNLFNLHIGEDDNKKTLENVKNNHFFIFTQQQLAGADGILFPALRQYLLVVGKHS